MNVRQEDRQKNACPSRGLGLAAAAIGVGVGAALYYFCSRRSQNPDGEGSTSHWSCEQPNTLPLHDHDSSFTTISEHSTTDTSINSTDESDSEESDESVTDTESDIDNPDSESSESSTSDDTIDSLEIPNISYEESFETGYLSLPNINISTDSEPDNEWDVTNSSIDVPTDISSVGNEPNSPIMTFFAQIGDVVIRKIHKRRQPEDTQMRMLRERAFRERSWSLEECSICYDVMLKDQEVTKLPCTHNFHSSCIAPWLQEQQTCPYCRKPTE